jgi:hypothetical protein
MVLDELISISIKDLLALKLLQKKGHKAGKVSFRSKLLKTECQSMYITVNTDAENSYIEFDYEANGKLYNYKILLIRKNSNLGNGSVFYFHCPVAKSNCKKLFFLDKRFASRLSIGNAMYDCQIVSKKFRSASHIGLLSYKIDALIEETNKPYSKRMYNGRLTKKMVKLIRYSKEIEITLLG